MPSHRVMYYQPRGGTPTWPEPSAPDARPADAAAAPAGTGSELSQPLCEGANRGMLIVAGAYALGVALVGTAVFVAMKKRLWGSRGARYAVATVLAAAAGAALAALDPARADDVTRCLNAPEYARFVVLSSSGAARAVALGLVPAALLTLLGCAVANRAY